jgi:hypothetical protein
MASIASRVSELNGTKNGSLLTANPRATPRSAPAMPARKADEQNTITFETLVDNPMAVTAVGESDMPCRSRPSRLRWTATTATAARTATTSTTR